MKLTEHIEILSGLFQNKYPDKKISTVYPLPISGSQRQYFRIETMEGFFAVGCFNNDVTENEAFFHFTKQFFSVGLPVPEIYSIHQDKKHYLIQDLGNKTLFEHLTVSTDFRKDVLPYYKKTIEQLIQFQLKGKNLIDFTKAYPREAFDKQSILWDLNYFKYYWLKFVNTPFNEQLLENDFQSFADFLLSEPHDYFLYRDFQSRNIMLQNEKLFFIDYQGGRKGALQYDLASLLYDSKANISEEIREELLDYYIQQLKTFLPEIKTESFKKMFYAYVLVRVLQAFGAYGYRGIYENKIHFLKSIPFAINNLRSILEKTEIPAPYLTSVLENMIADNHWKEYAVFESKQNKLHLEITSFSYRKPLPFDTSGNGGGFVFDCRILPNPGRIDQYKSLTGQDLPVKKYLEQQPAVHEYLDNVKSLVDSGIENYLERGFTNLMVNFGCTGGQHRSVYNAEQLYLHLKSKYDGKISISVHHNELNIKEQRN